MFANLFTYLKHEQLLLRELVSLAEKQQKALVKFDIRELEDITLYQAEVSKNLRQAEEQRISMLTAALKISRKDAANIALSSLEKYYQAEDLTEIRKLRLELRALTQRLQTLNTMNRVLANRARNSVGEILSLFMRGTNHLCNVKV